MHGIGILRGLGIKTYIDLQASADEEVPLSQQELNLSVMDVALATALDGSDTMEKMTCLGLFGGNCVYLDNCGEMIKRVLVILSSKGKLPCVLCCENGKDRTGLIDALIYSALCAF